jgi:hypothetical protein
MKRTRQRILIAVGTIRTCIFCFEPKPIVAVERNPANGEAEFVCGDCHFQLESELVRALGSVQR